MKRALLFLVVLTGCENFDALVERCLAEGRCGMGSGGGSGGNPGVLAANPASVDISSVIAETSMPKTIELENKGPGSVDNIVATRAGTDADDFALISACPQTLAAGAKCMLSLTFTPRPGTGPSRTARIEVRPARGNMLDVGITGTALPLFAVTSPVEFGDVTTGTQKTLSIMVTNSANAMRSVSAMATSPYTVETNGCGSVAPMGTCSIAVRFEPPSQGQADGVLNLTLIGTTTTQPVVLHGRGVAPSVLEVTPAMTFNGEQTDAGTFIDRPFTVRNTGTQTIGPIVPAIADAGTPFTVPTTDCAMLNAGATCTGTVRFSPPAYGSYAGRLDVAAGAAGTAQVGLLAHGTAVFTLTMGVTPADAGISVSGNVGASTTPCFNNCAAPIFASPTAVPMINVSFARTRTHDFGSWSGACTDGGACTIAMNTNKTVTAVSDPVPLVFITSALRSPMFGGPAGVDQFCRGVATDAGLPGSYMGLIGVNDGGVLGRLAGRRGWIRVDGRTVALTPTALVEGKHEWVIDRDEKGAVVAIPTSTSHGNYVWTGFLRDGGTVNCDDWTAVNVTPEGASGFPADGLSKWTQEATGGWTYCSSSTSFANRFYCIQSNVNGAALPTAQPPLDGGYRMYMVQAEWDGGGPTDGRWPDVPCEAAGRALGYAGPHRAFVASESATAWGRASPQPGPVYRPDGVLLYADTTNLQSGAVPLNPITTLVSPDASVTTIDAVVSTGTPAPDQYNSNLCQGWTTSGTGHATGRSGSRQAYWFTASDSCNGAYTFYCLSKF